MTSVEIQQRAVCAQYQTDFVVSPETFKVGIALNVLGTQQPINGLRHPPRGDTTGWYIWAGEALSNDPNFFEPLHVAHLEQWCPQVRKYLALPPGWRFLVADGYEDVWFDETLLDVE